MTPTVFWYKEPAWICEGFWSPRSWYYVRGRVRSGVSWDAPGFRTLCNTSPKMTLWKPSLVVEPSLEKVTKVGNTALRSGSPPDILPTNLVPEWISPSPRTFPSWRIENRWLVGVEEVASNYNCRVKPSNPMAINCITWLSFWITLGWQLLLLNPLWYGLDKIFMSNLWTYRTFRHIHNSRI